MKDTRPPVIKEVKLSESAKLQRRKHFNEMIEFLRRSRDVKVVLVENTDRLSRNLRDFVIVEDLVSKAARKPRLR
jgi:DNA invertase Pin-like site-specific DNA recombinase